MLREQTLGDPVRMRRALAGLRRYQEVERPPPPTPMRAIASISGAALRDYGGDGPPILFVPSLINPPNILDLGERSLLRWLAARGRHSLLLDWGWPDGDRTSLSVGDHVATIAAPLLAQVGEPVDLVGYCLGGTMAIAAACLSPVRSLTLIATPWHFDGYPAAARDDLARLWTDSRPAVDALGVLPMEVLQSAFWMLDPARTVAKFEEFASMEGDAARAFVALEDWANDGPPIGGGAARDLFEDCFRDDLPGGGRWIVGGCAIAGPPPGLPVLNIVSATDRIVPSTAAPRFGERFELGLGHVGMMVGSRAKEALWEPLARWLSARQQHC